MQRLAKISVLLAIGTLFLRRELFYLIKPFEILISLAVLFTIIGLIKNRKEWGDIKNTIKLHSDWVKIFFLIFIFSAIGTINGHFFYGLEGEIAIRTIGNFIYLLINSLAFFLIIHYSGQDNKFKRYSLLSFYSPLIFTPLIFMPEITDKLVFLSDGIHFYGLHKNPTTFAFLAFYTLMILIAAYLAGKERYKKFLYWIGCIAILSLIIWTGSRAAWLAAFAALIWIIMYLYKKSGKYAVKFSIIAIISVLISFLILPHETKVMAIDRIYPQISNNFPSALKLRQKSFKTIMAEITKNPMPSLPYQSRETIWPQALNLFINNPLGLGPEYFRLTKSIKQNGIFTHSHNTVLQAGLTGGIGLIIVYFFMIWKIIRKLISQNKPPHLPTESNTPQEECEATLNPSSKTVGYSRRCGGKDYEWLALSSIMLGNLMFSLIGELLFIIPWIWIAMALIVAKEKRF